MEFSMTTKDILKSWLKGLKQNARSSKRDVSDDRSHPVQLQNERLETFPQAILPKLHLCRTCSKIDFEALFSNPPATSESRGVLVASYPSFRSAKPWLRQCCHLCAFLQSTIDEYSRKRRYELRANTSARVLTRLDDLPDQKLHEPIGKTTTVLQVLRSDGDDLLRQFLDPVAWDLHGGIKILSLRSSHAAPVDLEITAKRLNRATVPFNVFKDLIARCQRSHTNCIQNLRDPKDTFVPGTMMVDCLVNKIVLYNENDDYLALSYVWGPRTKEEGQNPGNRIKDLSKAPATVKDAILATKEMGFRYLWVDAFCIQGADKAAREQQLRRMDCIYERAVAVLVGLGANAQTGLPGISHQRTAQPSVDLPSGTLVSTMRSLNTLLLGSPWLSRAWTYQEALLAQRCLFFTDEQVFFACRSLIQGEAISYVSYSNKLVLGPDLFSFDQKVLLEEEIQERQDSDNEMLKVHIHNYTTRNWTYPSDSLDAVLGILSRSTTDSLWGVPLLKAYNQDTKFFVGETVHSLARGLLWYSYHLHAAYTMVDINRMVSDKPNESRSSPLDQILVADVMERMKRYSSPSWSWT